MKKATVFVIAMLVFTTLAYSEMMAPKQYDLPISQAAIGQAIAAGVAIIVLLVIGGCLFCNKVTPPPQTSLNVQACIANCVAAGGDDFECLDQCAP